MIKYKDNSKQVIKELRKIHGGLEKVSVDVLNHAAGLIQNQYKRNIRSTFINRNKFTANAVRMFKAKATGSGGSLRKIKDINAVVFVPRIKGDDHYLKDQEEGATKRGAKSTRGFIATPTNKARTGTKYRGRIARASDLRKNKIQTLRLRGREFGKQGDGFRSDKQRFAVLYKYARTGNPYGWDLKKPFFLLGNVHVFKRNKFPMIRHLDEKTRKIKREPNFERAIDKVGTPQKMESIFQKQARKRLGKYQ